jgi:flagellar biosynthesis/type III secretory pathway chaperone
MDKASPVANVELSLAQAMERVARLEALLEQEFEALKAEDLKDFDQLNQSKDKLLKELMALTGVYKAEDAHKLDPQWNEFKDKMRYCRNLHRRSEILVSRKLDAIKGALESMRSVSYTSNVETYDKLGKVRRGRPISGYLSV